jgi:indolepyruvate ferredoxin oxidoreductase
MTPLADYRLDDALDARSGPIFLTGTQALVRLMLMQSAADRARGRATAGFVSGYRGSPLGAVDKAMWRAAERLKAADVAFLPAVNEELGATAVMGTQQVETDPQRTVEGVFAMWYGKGPGVDRAADALKHGNARGASPTGGVLVVAGDDHGCVSSSMPHQSDLTMAAWSMPVLHPANVAELLSFGLYGWAMSRASGAWVGLKAISETVESAASVDLDAIRTDFAPIADHVAPPDGLHLRWPDLPSPALEVRLAAKLDAVRAFARAHPIDRLVCAAPHGDVGIVTVGKAHLDALEALRRLGLDPDALEAAGVRLLKVGLVFPLEDQGLRRFAQGLREILVIEEKAPVVEQQLRALFYNAPAPARPVIIGKTGLADEPLLSALGELRPSRVIPVLADWLARHRPALDRRARVPEFVAPPIVPAPTLPRRAPYFCSGCPHNVSTRVPQGSQALAGIGCHYMASWMDRDTVGMIQMGGEGVDWVSHARFTRTPHVFQNLGDGTYFHSGFLAIRQAVAAGTDITYKILYNDAVAMTGGQPVEGHVTVDGIARQVEAEGARRVVVVSDEPGKYRDAGRRFPPGTSFHDRTELDAVQRVLRDTPGVTVLIYDQTCAAEKRRRRKQHAYPDPPRRIAINAAVCEGCGDCGRQSNCLSVVPIDTADGVKRAIDQSSCNKDYSCVRGLCPSFVSVVGGSLRRGSGAAMDEASFDAQLAALPEPPARDWDGPYDLLVTGVGGTGVVTLGALVTMAAHLEGRFASQLDFMGFAQKGGAVLSHVRLATRRHWLNQSRIDTQQADAMLGCDLVVCASQDALQAIRLGRTRVLANAHLMPIPAQVSDPDARIDGPALLATLQAAAGVHAVETLDAHGWTERLLGDTQLANVLLLGAAWQRGLVPVSRAAMLRAIALNGVAVAANERAFQLGRLAAHDPQALARLAGGGAQGEAPPVETLAALRARLHASLIAYQGPALARQFDALVDRLESAERAGHETAAADASAAGQDWPLTRAVATQYARLLAIKDEYEVARLHADPAFRRRLDAQFTGDWSLRYHLAPPLLARRGPDGEPVKRSFGPWLAPVLRGLAACRGVRGSLLDPFGHTRERRMERALARRYRAGIEALATRLGQVSAGDALAYATWPAAVRGFGHVKLAALAKAWPASRALEGTLGLAPAAGDARAATDRQAIDAAIAMLPPPRPGPTLRGVAIVEAKRA